jgi:hypothetical protein
MSCVWPVVDGIGLGTFVQICQKWSEEQKNKCLKIQRKYSKVMLKNNFKVYKIINKISTSTLSFLSNSKKRKKYEKFL